MHVLLARRDDCVVYSLYNSDVSYIFSASNSQSEHGTVIIWPNTYGNAVWSALLIARYARHTGHSIRSYRNRQSLVSFVRYAYSAVWIDDDLAFPRYGAM